MKGILTIILFFASGVYYTAHGQQLSNSGKEFWVAYGHNQFFEAGYDNGQQMVLYLSAEQAATVKVSINGTTWTRTYSVAANTVIATDYMPKDGLNDSRLYTKPSSFGGTSSEDVFNFGIHIESNVPVVAYAHIFGSHSSGATMLMPVETWGYSYMSLNFTQYFNQSCFSWINVIASHDNTKVQITTTAPSRGGHAANETFYVVLNKGQVYQMLGAGLNSAAGTGYDITGTTIKVVPNDAGECYRIAAFSGSSRTVMSMGNCAPRGGDCYIQQLFPSQAWGRRYLTAPTSISQSAGAFQPNYYRIAVTDPATEVRVNGAVLTGLISNRYYAYASSSADYITSDKPIMVAQYMPSTGCNESTVGDEEMILISPVEQAIKHVGFYRNNRENIDVNYLTLIIPANGVSSLRIDGSALFDHSYPHPNLAGYTIVVKRWTSAQKQVTVVSDSAFTAITYGLGGTESYGYNAGTLINNLNGSGDIRNIYGSQATSSYTCRNTPFTPALWIAYKPTLLRWAFSEAGSVAPATDVMEVMPEAIDSQKVGNLWLYRYHLPQSYVYKDTGMQQIPVYSTHPAIENCNHTEIISIPVKVNAAASADFTYSNSLLSQVYNGCRLDTVYLKPVTTATRYRWSFSSDAADTSLLEKPAKLYAAAGTYQVHLQGILADGCVNDTVKTIQIYAPPTAGFTLSAAAVCEKAGFTVTNTAAYSGTAAIQELYWSLGDGRTSGTAATSFPVTYAGSGSYTIRQVAKVSSLCISDTVSKIVAVNPRPVSTFSTGSNRFCANTTTTVTPQSAIAAGTIQNWYWNFGNGTQAVKQNSNAFTLAYTAGNYTITHYAVSDKGCTSDSATAAITVSPVPVADFTAPAFVCMPAGKAQFTNRSAVSDNGALSYTWSFGDQGATSAGASPLHIYKAAGSYAVRLRVVTAGGCAHDTTKTLSAFYNQPVAAFTLAPEVVCEGNVHTMADASTSVGSSVSAWYWNFGDGTTDAVASPVKRYLRPGTYRVGLAVTSAQGCVSDTAYKTARTYPYPVVDAGPSFVVAPGSRVTFAATASDVSGGVRWTPASSLSNAAILTPSLVVMDDQVYTLAVTGEGNCTATDSMSVRVVRTVVIPNVFTPNGDGINDTWAITNLNDYPGVTVQVFDRYGSRVLYTNGYARAWDGTYQQKPLAAGTYYYIIDLKNGTKPFSGSVTIIR